MREGAFAVKSSDAGCLFNVFAKVLNSQSERPSALPIHAEQRPGGLYSLDASSQKHLGAVMGICGKGRRAKVHLRNEGVASSTIFERRKSTWYPSRRASWPMFYWWSMKWLRHLESSQPPL